MLFIEQCLAHNRVNRSTGYLQWYLIVYSIRLAKHALLSIYVCMYFFLLLIRLQSLFRFFYSFFKKQLSSLRFFLRNHIIAQNYMAMLDLRISFSHHTFNFTFCQKWIKTEVDLFVFSMSLVLKGRNKYTRFIVLYSCPVGGGNKFSGVIKLFFTCKVLGVVLSYRLVILNHISHNNVKYQKLF